MGLVLITCGWCQTNFQVNPEPRDYGFGTNICPTCGRKVKSSKKEKGDKKNVKRNLEQGDIV